MRKKLPDRKHRALQRCAVLAGALVLLAAAGLYPILPQQAMAEQAGWNDVQHPKVVRWFHDQTLQMGWNGVCYLAEGGNGLLLGAAGFDPLHGWQSRGISGRAGTWDGTGLYGGVAAMDWDGREVRCLFGRVDAPEISALEVKITETDPFLQTETTHTADVPEESLFTANGQRYVLYIWPYQEPKNCETSFRLAGVSEAGETLTVTDLHTR